MKVIIAGGRSFFNYDLVKETLLPMKSEIECIISGRANGADSLGEKFAEEHGIEILYFPAEWDKYGRSAGYIRNKEMANEADFLVAFWDGNSKGTKHMIDIMKKQNKHGKVILY